MSVTLKLTSYHRLSPGQESEKTFGPAGGVVGRSSECSWCLPDPEKIISGKHLIISHDQGVYYVTDNSTNGLFIERSVEPLGRGNKAELKAGLHLTLGDYEIVVDAMNDESAEMNRANLSPKQAIPKPTKAYSSPTRSTNNSAKQVPEQTPVAILGIKPKANIQAPKEKGSPAPSLLSKRAAPVKTTIFADGADFAGDEHFEPPAFIPGNWDDDFLTPNASNNGEAEKAVPTSSPLENNVSTSRANNKVSAVNRISSADVAGAQRDPAANMSQTFTQSYNRPAPNQQAQYSQQVNASEALSAFFNGLDINPDNLKIQSELAFFNELGGVMRMLLQGILDTLASRSSLKNEFRVLQTTIRPNENNPLKFSATVEDAIRNVFGNLGGSFLAPKEAVEEAFQDINRHQLALLSGTQGALLELLKYLQPKEIERRTQLSNSIVETVIPATKKAKCWDFYHDVYSDLMKDAEGKSPKLFTAEFAKAYEQQLKRFE